MTKVSKLLGLNLSGMCEMCHSQTVSFPAEESWLDLCRVRLEGGLKAYKQKRGAPLVAPRIPLVKLAKKV